MAISEWQILFNKIKHDIGSPFGVIREVFFYDYSPNNPNNNSPQLKQFLEYKCHFIGFVETFIGPSESLFFVYKNGPSATFNLKNYLLVLAKIHCNPTAICYCENKQDAQNTDTKEIKFLSAKSHDFGKELDSISVELSNPKTFIQSLLKLGSFLHGKAIESLNNPTNYPPINLVVTPGLAPWETTVEIEKHRIKTIDNHYKQSSAQNFKINEITENLKSGKIVGEKIISNALSYASKEYIGSSYCFIDPKNLETQLVQYKQDLLNDIIIEINQIKIEYNLLDDAFYFIFDIDNSHQLIVNVPRKELRDMRLPKMRTRESHSYLKIQSILKSCVRKGFYIIQNKTIVNILTPKSLEMQLLQKLSQNKADLSNHIIEVLNYQLSFQPHQPPIITYALIRKIRYNFNYNTFHFIFDIVNFLDEKLEFIIEVPREALDLENIDRLVEKNHSQGSFVYHISEGSYIIDLYLIDD